MTTPRHHPAQGFSLIELMISILISSILIFAITGIILSNQRTYKTNYALSDMQESARAAFELLVNDIRGTADDGCTNKRLATEHPYASQWWASNGNGGSSAGITTWQSAVYITPASFYGILADATNPTNSFNLFNADRSDALNYTNLSHNQPLANSQFLILKGAGALTRTIDEVVNTGTPTSGASGNAATAIVKTFPSISTAFPDQGLVVLCDWKTPGVVALADGYGSGADSNNLKLYLPGGPGNTTTLPELERSGVISEYNVIYWYVSQSHYLIRAKLIHRPEAGSSDLIFQQVAIFPNVYKFNINAHVRDTGGGDSPAFVNGFTASQAEYRSIADKSRIDALKIDITIGSSPISFGTANRGQTDDPSKSEIKRDYTFYAPILARTNKLYKNINQ